MFNKRNQSKKHGVGSERNTPQDPSRNPPQDPSSSPQESSTNERHSPKSQ